MSQARRPRRVVQILSVLCVALAITIYSELTRPVIGLNPAVAPGRRVQTPDRDPTFSMPPLGAYAEVVARSLFSPTRRPPLEMAPGRPSDFRLVGTIISASGRDALLAHGTPPKIAHVGQGENFEGWIVKSIEPDHVVLVRDGRMTDITISAKQPVTKVAPPSGRQWNGNPSDD